MDVLTIFIVGCFSVIIVRKGYFLGHRSIIHDNALPFSLDIIIAQQLKNKLGRLIDIIPLTAIVLTHAEYLLQVHGDVGLCFAKGNTIGSILIVNDRTVSVGINRTANLITGNTCQMIDLHKCITFRQIFALGHSIGCSHGNIGNADDLAVMNTQRHRTICTGLLHNATNRNILIRIRSAIAGQIHCHRERGLIRRRRNIGIVHALAHRQEAVLYIVVSKDHIGQRIFRNSAAGDRGTGNSIAIDLHIADLEAILLCLGNGVLRTGVKAGDGSRFTGCQCNGQLLIRQFCFCAIDQNLIVSIFIEGDGKVKGSAGGSGNTVHQFLGQGDTRCGGISQPAVVAQVHQLVVTSDGIAHIGIHHLLTDIAESLGGIIGLNTVMAVGIGMHGALGDVPCAILSLLGILQSPRYQFAIVRMHIRGILAVRIFRSGCLVSRVLEVASGGLGAASILSGAIFIGINSGIAGEIVMLILYAGLKVCVGQIVGGRIIQIGGICLPCVGVQVVLTIVRAVRICDECAIVLNGQLIDQCLVHTHFVQQADRLCLGSGDLGAARLDGIVLIQLHLDLVGNHRQQGCGDPEGDHLHIGFKILADLHGDIHHVRRQTGSRGSTQHAVACIAVHRAGRGIGIGSGPGGHIVALSITVPANEVAEILGIGIIAELTVLPCFTDQLPCLVVCLLSGGTGNAKAFLDSTNHLITQCSGISLGTQPDAVG